MGLFRHSYDQWRTQKNHWDKAWKVNEGGPSAELREELETRPHWCEDQNGNVCLKPMNSDCSTLFASITPHAQSFLLIQFASSRDFFTYEAGSRVPDPNSGSLLHFAFDIEGGTSFSPDTQGYVSIKLSHLHLDPSNYEQIQR